MEKLQPLIKHKYWVIAGLSLLLPIVGWWLSTGAVAETIENRWQTLSALKVPPGTNTPNEDYLKGIEQVNTVLAERQAKLDADLYEKQKSLHTWPRHVATFMDGKQFRDTDISNTVLSTYASHHMDEIEGMLRALPWYQYNSIRKTETGIVWCERGVDTIPHGPEWKRNPPTPEVMWDTQEDVWLTRAILNAIKKVNSDAGATKITDAPIRVLNSIQLRGGSRPDETAPAPGGEGEMEGDDGSPPAAGGVFMPGSRFGADDADGTDGGSSYGAAFQGQININLEAVFGPDTVQAVTGGEDGEGGGGPAAGLNGGSSQGVRRYVDDKPELPYKTRGFYLEVIMLHDKLPDLQAALVSMPWPTELLMIHQVSDKIDEILPELDSTTGKGIPPGSGRPGGNFPPRNRFAPNPGQGGRFTSPTPRFGGAGSRFGASGRSGSRFSGPRGNPMGNRFPMGPMEGEGEIFDPSQQTSFSTALDDFYLTKIGIAGLMTIYRSPQEIAANRGGGAEQNLDPPQEQIEQPAPENNVPEGAEPATVPEGTEPGTVPEGAEPMANPQDGTATDPSTTNPPADNTNPQTNPGEPADAAEPPLNQAEQPPAEESPPPEEAAPPPEE